MADTFLSLADLVKINDNNLADIDVSDILDDAPFMKALAADVASNGTDHKYLKETTAPVVGFRAANTGRENKDSTDTLVTINLKILDASFAIDKALADAYKNGPQALIAREGKRHLKAAFFKAEQQFLNGTDSDSDGFTGLADALGLANAMTYNATGTTSNTGSSVYLVRTNADGVDCTAITGQDGEIMWDDSVVQAIEDTSNGGRFSGYYTPIEGWLGLQVGSANSVGRIVNLTEDSGKGLTDDVLAEALALFPASRQPNLIVMNRRSRKQLQQSRTATNSTGAPAPFPTEAFGVPIVTTDAITSTEAILS